MMLNGFSLAHAGLLGVFLLMVLHPGAQRGHPAGRRVAVHQGRMPLAAAIAAATAGNLAGSLIAYALGRLTARWQLWAWAQACAAAMRSSRGTAAAPSSPPG